MHSICRPRKNTKQKDIYHKISFAVLSCSSGLHSCNNILTLSMLQLMDVSWQQLKKKQCNNKNEILFCEASDKFQNVVDVCVFTSPSLLHLVI